MSVDVVSRVPQRSVLEQFFILYTSELVHIIENHMVGYADDATIYAVIPRPLNQKLVAIHYWCLKWHMWLKPKKINLLVNRSRKYAPGNGDFTLGGAELEGIKSLLILSVTFDSK